MEIKILYSHLEAPVNITASVRGAGRKIRPVIRLPIRLKYGKAVILARQLEGAPIGLFEIDSRSAMMQTITGVFKGGKFETMWKNVPAKHLTAIQSLASRMHELLQLTVGNIEQANSVKKNGFSTIVDIKLDHETKSGEAIEVFDIRNFTLEKGYSYSGDNSFLSGYLKWKGGYDYSKY